MAGETRSCFGSLQTWWLVPLSSDLCVLVSQATAWGSDEDTRRSCQSKGKTEVSFACCSDAMGKFICIMWNPHREHLTPAWACKFATVYLPPQVYKHHRATHSKGPPSKLLNLLCVKFKGDFTAGEGTVCDTWRNTVVTSQGQHLAVASKAGQVGLVLVLRSEPLAFSHVGVDACLQVQIIFVHLEHENCVCWHTAVCSGGISQNSFRGRCSLLKCSSKQELLEPRHAVPDVWSSQTFLVQIQVLSALFLGW